MAIQLNSVSFVDFLKGLMRSSKGKNAKVKISEITYWLTDWERLDQAARVPGMYIKYTGTETLVQEDGTEVTYQTFQADLEGSGDLKKLAIET